MNEPRSIRVTDGERPDDRPLPLKLRLEDYLLLDEAGAFDGYTRTELIDGEIVYMNAQHRPLARVKSDLAFMIRVAVEAAAIPLAALVEASIAVPPRDVPEPDIVLASEPDGDGLVPLPSVALVVEVSDASLSFDLGRKRSRYAGVGIPEYWVADVNARIVHQFWAPSGASYTGSRAVPFGQSIGAETIAGLVVTTTRLG